jgi:gamma-glutamyltranspeptidase/glutathione hydrolase
VEWAGAVWKLKADRATADLYLPGGAAPLPGDVFRCPALARTLRLIAERGAAALYSGGSAAAMVDCLRAHGGHHTLDDFAGHRGAYVEPVAGSYGPRTVWQVPPNGAGVTTLLLLSILEALDFGREDPAGPRYHHLLARATKLAYGERNARLGDPRHGAIDLSPFLDKAHAARLAARIEDAAQPSPRRYAAGMGDTAYVSVVDNERNAVSLISSLFENFGCGIADPETGVVFHCRGAGFRLDEPDHPNSIGPAKRPLHTILPGMVSENGRVAMAFGVTGGPFQPIGQSRIISALLDRGLDIQAAIDEPRSFFSNGMLQLEPRLASLSAPLADLGHRVTMAESPVGGAYGITIDWTTGVLTGGADPRKDGCAVAV